MRFREDNPADLARARAAVAEWREKHPAGTEEQLTEALGPEFHSAYGPVLHGILFAVDREHAGGVTLAGVQARHGTRWDSIGQRPGEIGWWASREAGDADRSVTHHIVGRNLPELDAELTDLEKPDGDDGTEN